MCPIETPEGPNIGLIGALATYARVNEYGFIETPYRTVKDGRVTDEVSYLAADEEEEHVIAQANASVDTDGRLTEDRVLVRRGPQGTGVRVGAVGGSYGTTSEIDFVPPSEVDLMDVSPKQIVSVSTALIPFVEHDDANRALMGANMQKQAVPLVVPEAPYIGTGVEARAARDAGDVRPRRGQRHRQRDQRRLHHGRVRPRAEGPPRDGAGPQGLPALQVPPLQPEHVHQPPHTGGRGAVGIAGRPAGRRPVDPQRRAGAGQEPARRLHAVGGLQLRGRHHPLGAPGARRRADLHPHRGARGRRPRHQAGRRGDHPGHPEPVRGDPGRPRRPRHHPRRRRGGAGRRPGRARSPPRARPSRRPRSGSCAPSSARRRARCATRR